MLSYTFFQGTGKINWKTKEEVQKPDCVVDYNQHMGGVDVGDQMIASYDFSRKTRRWYLKLFVHVLAVMVLDAYILYKKSNRRCTHKAFLCQLVEEMIERYHCGVPGQGRHAVLDPPTRLTERHFPTPIPATPKKARPCRTCHVCNAKVSKVLKAQGLTRNREGAGKRGGARESRYMCVGCGVTLCVHPCFKLYHTQKDYLSVVSQTSSEDEE